MYNPLFDATYMGHRLMNNWNEAQAWVDIARLTLPQNELELNGQQLLRLQGYSELFELMKPNESKVEHRLQLLQERPVGLSTLAEPASGIQLKLNVG